MAHRNRKPVLICHLRESATVFDYDQVRQRLEMMTAVSHVEPQRRELRPREQQIMALIQKGFRTRRSIAGAISLSEAYVGSLVKNCIHIGVIGENQRGLFVRAHK